MEDGKTLELSIEKTKIYAENYKYLESKPNVQNLLKTRRKSSNSTCSPTTTLDTDHAEMPQSCGSICVFDLHQKLIFNCEFCDLKYGDLDNFGRHLYEAHNLLLQTEEPIKENASIESKSNRISNVVKKEPLEPAIDLPPSYINEPLVSCGNVFIRKERRFLMACGYCDCSKYDNLEMFEKHIKSQHNILEGAHNELNVVPKVEETIKEEFFTITELEHAKIKEANVEVKKIEAKIKVEQNSKEEFQDIEREEEEDEDNKGSELDDDEFIDEDSSTSSSAAKCKRFASKDEPSKSTTSKKDTIRKKKENKNGLSAEEKPYACEYCEKKFKTNYYLKLHITLHTGETNFKCDICNKCFRAYGNFKNHYTKHFEGAMRTYGCDLCDKKFSRKDTLTIHKRLHTGEKPYECDICHKQCHDFTLLRQHKMRHLGEAGKSFKCQYCDKKFLFKHDLTTHTRVHTGEKPFKCEQLKTFKCDYCDKFFQYNSYRKKHMRVHTGEKPFKCDVCQRCFARKDSLRSHAEKYHPATVNKSNDVV